jgi:hypothetical protein
MQMSLRRTAGAVTVKLVAEGKLKAPTLAVTEPQGKITKAKLRTKTSLPGKLQFLGEEMSVSALLKKGCFVTVISFPVSERVDMLKRVAEIVEHQLGATTSFD